MKKLIHILCLVALFSTNPGYAKEERLENAFSPHQGASDLIINTIGKARKTLHVAAYTFTSKPIADAMINASTRGVDVKVVLDKRQSHGRGSLANYLSDRGIQVKRNGEYAIMHNKFMIIDQKVLELGSFNYTKAAEEKNAENILVIRRAPKIIKEYTEQWDKLWQEAE